MFFFQIRKKLYFEIRKTCFYPSNTKYVILSNTENVLLTNKYRSDKYENRHQAARHTLCNKSCSYL